MSEEEELFVKSNGNQHTLECALVWHGLPPSMPSPIPPARFGWTEKGKSLLDRIRRVATATKRPEGNELPYADLRAALQARVPGLVLLESWIFPRDEGAPLFAANGSPADVKAAAHRATSAWCQLTLRPWAERLGTDCGDIDVLEAGALEGDIFESLASPTLPLHGQVPDALRSDFHDFADILLSIAAPALEGVELFAGLGPVHRVIDREYGNTISFETWPSTLPGGEDLFSMVALISVETRPSSRLPFLVVRATKRIWCNEFPAANQLYGRRRISVRVLTRGPDVRGVTLSVRIGKGAPKPNLDALFFEAGRVSGESFTEDLLELVKTRGRMPNLFVGVPFRYGYKPAPKIQFGVTLQDQVDLTRAVKERISKFGFEESRLRVLDPATNRPEEFHQQANLYNLITHHFGQVPGEELPIRVKELFGSPEKKPRGRPRPIKTVDLEPILRANQERLDKAFGKQTEINLMFVCRREAEEGIFRSVVGLLFGDRVNVVRHALPEGVHGTRKALDGAANLNRTQRAALRKTAWTTLAEQIRDDFPNSPAIVQAARKYDGFQEDQVNKDVGRNTLATVAGCNVQYLLPPGTGNAAEYMHRVQAALYDLLFGHAGLGPVPAGVVSSTFEGPSSPRSIVGISVVSQAASRTGRPEGAALAVAMKIDVSTGRINGRIGHLRTGGFDRGKFQTLSRTLVDVASAGRTSLGEKHQDRRKNFLSFVRGVIDEVASDDPNALVLLESTTSRSLWSWLSDENISSDIYLEDSNSRPPISWKGLRFVRVREKSAGRIAVESQRKWTPVTRQGEPRQAATIDEVYATAVERLVESLPEGNARARHYLTAHGFDVRNQGARGQSVYRKILGFQRVGAKTPKGGRILKGQPKTANKVLSQRGFNDPWHVVSRIPTTLEITVLPSQLGDDEDAVATLVSGLRNGYSHTADGTFLPAPLSFRSKILDYMDRYATGPEDDDPDDGLAAEEEVEISDDDELVERAVGYGEIRRWFEGSAEFAAGDIPAFEDDEAGEQSSAAAHFLPPSDPSAGSQPTANCISDPEVAQAVDNPSSDTSMMMGTPKQTPSIEAEPMDASSSEESNQTKALVHLLRTSSAPLPAFVDEKFLAEAMHLVPRDVRHMHEDRQWIRAVTGFPWPEERPGIQDIPRLYLEALKYPAFAIIFQHQFFPDDNGRGLPKSAIHLKNRDFWQRLRKQKPLPKSEADLLVLCALHAADNGGDTNALLADVLGLPGQAAWRSPCSRASAGLDRLEARSGEWGELGRYLRAVVGPFARFGDERTVGEIIDEVVIPCALEQAAASASPPAPTVADEEGSPHTPPGRAESHPAGEESLTIAAVGPTSFDEIVELWRLKCDRILETVVDAKSNGPDGDNISRIREELAVLEDLQIRAAQLKPSAASTGEFKEAIRALTANVSEALTSLIGEALNAPKILSQLFDLPDEASPPDVETASELRAEAERAMSDAASLVAEIARLESTLPVKRARQETAPLIEAQEQSLRGVLDLVERAVGVLSTRAVASDGPRPPDVVESIDAAQSIDSQPPQQSDDSIVSPVVPMEDFEDLPDEQVVTDEPAEEEPQFAPVSEAKVEPAQESPSVDPLRNEVAVRLDRLFSIGEHGLAYHLCSAAIAMMPQSEEMYTPVELRLAAAGGRTIGVSAQELASLAELRSEALPTAQSLYGLQDDRSVARLSLLLAGALPAALFRSDHVSAVLLVEGIGGRPEFKHYEKLVSVVDENRKLNFPLRARP